MLTTRQMNTIDVHSLYVNFTRIGWVKPEAVFARYLAESLTGRRWTRVADWDAAIAGYVTLVWESDDPVLRAAGIPEIVDLNVLPEFRGRGVGSRLLDEAEAAGQGRSETVGLRVGLHSGYGAAQRLYVRRGYLPDGQGAVREGESIPEGALIALNDDVTLRMTKVLGTAESSRGRTGTENVTGA